MGSVSITTVGEGLAIHLPEEVAERLDIQQGDEVSIEEKGAILLIRPAGAEGREPLREFADAVGRLRTRVREAGGISGEQIDEAVRRVRDDEAHRRR